MTLRNGKCQRWMNMEKINQNIKKKNQKSRVAQHRTGIYEAEKKKKEEGHR